MSNIWYFLFYSQNLEVQELEIKMGLVPFSITPKDWRAEVLSSVPTTLCSVAGLDIFIPAGGILPPGGIIIIPLNYKWRLTPTYSGLLVPLNQQAKKQLTVLAGMMDPDDQGSSGPLLFNGGKESAWNKRDPLGYLLVLPYAVMKVNAKL